jgi:anti-anti-sigma factor
MLVKSEMNNGTATCVFSGSLDTLDSNKMEASLLKAVEKAEAVIFDMEDVEYISSNFIRLCSKVSKNVTSFDLSFINVSDDVLKILSMTGITKHYKATSSKDL